jgi:Lon protease-like protein
MAETLPLFPLGTVLYPGMILPLHVFEERYRRLVRDLLAEPEPRKFGVIAIRHGREVGDAPPDLHQVGCVAVLREATPHDDGRFDLVTIGGDRFRLLSADQSSGPYLRGSVEPIADEIGEPAALPLVPGVRAAFAEYLDLLPERGGPSLHVPDIPEEPVLLSYVIAAAMILGLPDRQTLLEAAGAARRLADERVLLRRELGMLRLTHTRPAPDLRLTDHSPN